MKLAIKQNGEQLARPLKVLVPLINRDLSEADRLSKKSIEFYAAAGEKLIEAKDQVSRGEWGNWLRENFNRSQRQANQYMKAARQIRGGREFESLKDMERKTRPSFPAGLPEDIRRIMRGINIDVDELSEDDLSDKKESGLMRNLAKQLINAGYRALSLKLHPDKGGSSEAMRRLNKVRGLLLGGTALLHE